MADKLEGTSDGTVIRPFFISPPSLPLLQLLLHPLFTHSHSPVYSSYSLLKPSKEVWGSTVSFPQCPAQRRNVSQLQKLEGIKYTRFWGIVYDENEFSLSCGRARSNWRPWFRLRPLMSLWIRFQYSTTFLAAHSNKSVQKIITNNTTGLFFILQSAFW